MIIALPPEPSASLIDSGWALVIFSFLQFILTIFIIVGRVSSMLKNESNNHVTALAAHETNDQAAFAKLTQAITAGDDKLREEIASIATALRASVMAAQADITQRINQVELHTERTFLPRDSFYAALSEMKSQNKDDFTEIKEWLKRLESKIDAQ